MVMKVKKGQSTETTSKEEKVDLGDSKGQNIEYWYDNISLYSSSNIPFMVEAKLEIPTYDGQVNVEKLNS